MVLQLHKCSKMPCARIVQRQFRHQPMSLGSATASSITKSTIMASFILLRLALFCSLHRCLQAVDCNPQINPGVSRAGVGSQGRTGQRSVGYGEGVKEEISRTFLHSTSYTRHFRVSTPNPTASLSTQGNPLKDATEPSTGRLLGIDFRFRTLKPNAMPMVQCEWGPASAITSSTSAFSSSSSSSIFFDSFMSDLSREDLSTETGNLGRNPERPSEGGQVLVARNVRTDGSKGKGMMIVSLKHGTLHISARQNDGKTQTITIGVGLNCDEWQHVRIVLYLRSDRLNASVQSGLSRNASRDQEDVTDTGHVQVNSTRHDANTNKANDTDVTLTQQLAVIIYAGGLARLRNVSLPSFRYHRGHLNLGHHRHNQSDKRDIRMTRATSAKHDTQDVHEKHNIIDAQDTRDPVKRRDDQRSSPSPRLVKTAHFVGCLSDVILLDSVGHATRSMIAEEVFSSRDVLDGCRNLCDISADNPPPTTMPTTTSSPSAGSVTMTAGPDNATATAFDNEQIRCRNGGQCVNYYTTTRCDCHGTGHEGISCEKNGSVSLTLDGTDFLIYSTLDLDYWPPHRSNRIALQFKTSLREGALFYARQTHPHYSHTALSLHNASLHVSAIFVDQEAYNELILSVGNQLNDNQWHSVLIVHKGKQVEVTLDRRPETMTLEHSHNHLSLPPLVYYGGIDWATNGIGLRSDKNFVGCMRGLYYNDIAILDDTNSVSLRHHAGRRSLQFGCHDAPPQTGSVHSGSEGHDVVQFTNGKRAVLIEADPSDRLQLEFAFRTTRPDGVLASVDIVSGNTAKGILKWSLLAGQLETVIFLTDLNGSNVKNLDENITMDNARKRFYVGTDLANNEWHFTKILYTHGYAEIEVDSFRIVEVIQPVISFGQTTYIGQDSSNTSAVGYIGCMKDIRFQNTTFNTTGLTFQNSSYMPPNRNDLTDGVTLGGCSIDSWCQTLGVLCLTNNNSRSGVQDKTNDYENLEALTEISSRKEAPRHSLSSQIARKGFFQKSSVPWLVSHERTETSHHKAPAALVDKIAASDKMMIDSNGFFNEEYKYIAGYFLLAMLACLLIGLTLFVGACRRWSRHGRFKYEINPLPASDLDDNNHFILTPADDDEYEENNHLTLVRDEDDDDEYEAFNGARHPNCSDDDYHGSLKPDVYFETNCGFKFSQKETDSYYEDITHLQLLSITDYDEHAYLEPTHTDDGETETESRMQLFPIGVKHVRYNGKHRYEQLSCDYGDTTVTSLSMQPVMSHYSKIDGDRFSIDHRYTRDSCNARPVPITGGVTCDGVTGDGFRTVAGVRMGVNDCEIHEYASRVHRQHRNDRWKHLTSIEGVSENAPMLNDGYGAMCDVDNEDDVTMPVDEEETLVQRS